MADLTVTSSHSGNLVQGQTANYAITVNNIGTSPTSGAVTAVDNLPSALTATALSGSGWICTLTTLTCTRSDALASNASYPVIALTVNVALNAPASLTSTVTVSGGSEQNTANNTANDVATIVCSASLTSLCGQFGFLLDGFDANGPYHVVGTFTADGFGNLTAGIFDEARSNSTNGPITIQSGSKYTLGSDGRGTMNMTTAQGSKAFHFVVSARFSGAGNVIESDPANGTHATGYFVSQRVNPNFRAGSQAMGLVGENASGGRVGLIASFSSDENCGFTAGNTVTVNDAGSVSNNVSFSGTCANGGVSTIDPITGRGQASFTFSGGPFDGTTLHFVFYIFANSTDAFNFTNQRIVLLGQDPATSTIPILTGLMPGKASLLALACANRPCLFGEWGKTPAGDADVSIGRFVRQSDGTLTRTLDQNKGGVITSNSTTAGFTISPGGVGTISPPAGSSTSKIDFVALQNSVSAFFLSRDSSVSFGFITLRNPDPGFTPAVPLTLGLNGIFGPDGPPPTSQVGVAEGLIVPSGATAGNFSGTWDAATAAGFTSTPASGSFTIDTTTGRGTGTLNIPGDPVNATPSVVFYDGLLMENDTGNTAPRLFFPQ